MANRQIAGSIKVSLHQSGEWHYAFNTPEKAAGAGLAEPEGRFIKKWGGEDGRLGRSPMRQAFAVVLGGFSLGLEPELSDPGDRARLEKSLSRVDWVTDLPPDGAHAWQFTTLVADAGIATSPPGVASMGAVPIGGFVLSNGASVWVMQHAVTLGKKGLENIERAAYAAIEQLGPPTMPTVYHTGLSGQEPTGLQWVVEIAVTASPRPS
jgi:hypothetical protein